MLLNISRHGNTPRGSIYAGPGLISRNVGMLPVVPCTLHSNRPIETKLLQADRYETMNFGIQLINYVFITIYD